MVKKFWKPSLTSQFTICPIPFHMDSYRGCVYNCQYCFARDFVTFARRNRTGIESTFAYLEGNRHDLLKNWIERTLNKNYDYSKGEEVAFKERIPLKIGATSDPFPPIEKTEHITKNILKVLHEYNYPVEIQTKNPEVLLSYIDEFKKPNWTIAVTLISTDEKFLKVFEPSAPSAKKRLSAIKKITDKGIPVMIKIQPAIYPKILDDMEDLLKQAKKSGVWAFNTEGLKIRISMPKHEQEIFKTMSNYLKFDLRDYYKKYGVNTGSDYELLKNKSEYISLAEKYAEKYDLKYFSADNEMVGGCSGECCGTEVLKDYKILGNTRTDSYKTDSSIISSELGKVLCNFSRSQKNKNLTINEVIKNNTKKIFKKIDIQNMFEG